MWLGALQPQVVSGSSSGCVTDTSVGPASVMVGNLVQGNRLAVAQGRDIGLSDDNERKVSSLYIPSHLNVHFTNFFRISQIILSYQLFIDALSWKSSAS